MRDFPDSSPELAILVRDLLPWPIPWSDTGSLDRLTDAVDFGYDQLVLDGKSRSLRHFCLDLSCLAYVMIDCLQSDDPAVKAGWVYRATEQLLKRAGLVLREEPPTPRWLLDSFLVIAAPEPNPTLIARFFASHWRWDP